YRRRFKAAHGYASKLGKHGDHRIFCTSFCCGNPDSGRKVVIKRKGMVERSNDHRFQRRIKRIILYHDEPFYRASRSKPDPTLQNQDVTTESHEVSPLLL